MTKHKRYISEAEYMNSCDMVIETASKSKPDALIRYAATYAKQGKFMQGKSRQIQCLYILSNLSGWKGEQARYAKAIFKHFSTYEG